MFLYQAFVSLSSVCPALPEGSTLGVRSRSFPVAVGCPENHLRSSSWFTPIARRLCWLSILQEIDAAHGGHLRRLQLIATGNRAVYRHVTCVRVHESSDLQAFWPQSSIWKIYLISYFSILYNMCMYVIMETKFNGRLYTFITWEYILSFKIC